MRHTEPQYDPPTILLPSLAERERSPVVAPTRGDSTPPVAVSAERALFEQRLTAVLRGAVEGLDFDRADLFRLDDATSELSVAASHGMPASTAALAPRALRAAHADVTAMAGEAVVLEDELMVADYGAPRMCGAAVCVPVASDRTIHGTLWLYHRRPRSVGDSELQLIEIVAGRLAVELERRELLLTTERRGHSPLNARGAGALLPAAELEFDELEVAGRTTAPTALHDWAALPDGRVLAYAAAMVDAPGVSPDEGALTMQATRVALRSHAPTANDAGQLLDRVARTLSDATGGGAGVSLAAVLVDPETGLGTYALAGAAAALRVRASHQHTATTEDPPVGWDGDQSHRAVPLEMNIRERLVLAVGDPGGLDTRGVKRVARAFKTVTANEHRAMTARRALDVVSEHAHAKGVAIESTVALRRR